MQSIKHILALAILGSLSNASCASTPRPISASNNLSCTIGPAQKTYGGNQWNVYGCNDGRSVAIISAAGSAAMPFYFFFAWGSDGIELHGEGTGNKQATDAAFKELKPLTEVDVAALFQEAKAASGSSGK
jgi:hypothetical protein